MDKKVQECPPIKSFNLICRACLKKSDKVYPINGITFSDSPLNSVVENIVNMSSVFEKYCSIEISDMDRKPQNLCHSCMKKAYTSYYFFEKCLYSNQLLTTTLQIDLNQHRKKLNLKPCNDISENMAPAPKNGHTFISNKTRRPEISNNQEVENINTRNIPKNAMKKEKNILSARPKSPYIFLLECNMLDKGSPSNPMDIKDQPKTIDISNTKHIKQEKDAFYQTSLSALESPYIFVLESRIFGNKSTLVNINIEDKQITKDIANIKQRKREYSVSQEQSLDTSTETVLVSSFKKSKQEIKHYHNNNDRSVIKGLGGEIPSAILQAGVNIKNKIILESFSDKQHDKTTISNEIIRTENLAGKSSIKHDEYLHSVSDWNPSDNILCIQQKGAESAINPKQLEKKSENPLAYLFKSTDTMHNNDLFLEEIINKNEPDTVINLLEEDRQNKLTSSFIIANQINKKSEPRQSLERERFDLSVVTKKLNAVKGDVKEDNYVALKDNKVIKANINRNQDFIQISNKEDLQKPNQRNNSGINAYIKKIVNSDLSTLICNIEMVDTPNRLCRFCSIVLKDMEEVIKHVNLCHSQTMKCIICYGYFTTRQRLIFHTAQHFENSLICQICHLYFSKQNLLDEHNEEYKEIHANPKVCPICKKISRSRSVNERHMRVHKKKNILPVEPVLCYLCGEPFGLKSKLQEHLIVFHQKNISVSELCYICGKTLQSTSALEKHLKSCYQNNGKKKIFSCKFCSLEFKDRETYQKHLNAAHEKRYVCHFCGKTFFFYKTLGNHLPNHKEKKYSECNRCQKKILSRNIKAHIIRHCNSEFQVRNRRPSGRHPSKTHNCELCNKKCKDKQLLKKHLKIHEGSYRCPYCSICYANKKLRTCHIQLKHPEFAKEFLAERGKHVYKLKKLRLLKAKQNKQRESSKKDSQVQDLPLTKNGL